MDTFYVSCFVVLLIICVLAQYVTYSTSELRKSRVFLNFQYNFLSVYLISMAADWLQGPYVYALYEFYGFSEKEIGQLFIAGFGSSMIFGTVVGSFADKYGRKKNCILFGIIYALSCITKHFNNYNILMVGRLLGGIATSLLFSAFESWMVFEHNKHQYPGDLLSNTFSLSTFGNGIIAILAGLIANTVAGKWGFVAPFDTSLVLLIVEIIIVSLTWTENYGDQKIELQASFSNAWKSMIADPKIWLLGSIQSLFEGAMYIFVFKWTPSLASKIPGETIPHGFIFACFMVSVMIGSGLFKFLIARHKVENFSRFMFAVATFSLAVPIFTESRPIRLFGFFLFEVCCGIFWPCLGTMRGKYVPEEVRATIMNFFRVPLNLIVVLILLKTGDISTQTVFTCCTALLLAATLCQQRLYNLTKALADQHLQTALLSKEDLEETDEAPRFGGH